jgi:octaprenyl-diphosphate synthase
MSLGTVPTLAALLGPLRADLELVEEEIRRMTAADAPPLARLIEHISQFSGKRLRPALTLLSGRLLGGELRPEHHSVAAIIELIHTATLVHDDILDESVLRRRVATVNHQVGNETAVLLGDYIFATSFKEASALENRFASRYLAEIVAIVCRGEILQVHHRSDVNLPERTYFRIIEDKTAALYAAALRAGAVLSGAPDEQGEAAARYGLRVGAAFQIMDDILDLTGTESAVGKSLGTDLEKAKMTLPLIRLRDRARGEDLERLRRAIRSGDAEERRGLRPLLDEYGAIASARATAEELVADARRQLARLPDRPERDVLDRAAEYVLARDC